MSYNEVDTCPHNETEFTTSATRLNCGVDKFGYNQYTCVPKFNRTALVEFCYNSTVGYYPKDHCLRVVDDGSLNSYSCSQFTEGCPADHYRGSDLYQFPACSQLNTKERCFYAEPSCPNETWRSTTEDPRGSSTSGVVTNYGISNTTPPTNGVSVGAIVGGVVGGLSLVAVIFGIVIAFICWKRRKKQTRKNEPDVEDTMPLIDSCPDFRESSPETMNAIRVSLIFLGPCTDGLRDILHHYIPPPTFSHFIKRNLPRLNKDQRNLILSQNGSCKGNYNHMDISLLYILLRNITDIRPHSNGWGKDPVPSDRSLSASIERVRLIRNKCYHSIGASMSNIEFDLIWCTIRSVMIILDTFLNNGQKYEKAMDSLLNESIPTELDQHSTEELMRKQVEEELRTTRTMVINLKEQYEIEIQKWRKEDKLYCETHNFPSVMEKVRSQPFITFVGVPGSGKSATAHHIALKLQEEGYEVVPINDVRKMDDYGDPRNPQVFVIDDVVGVFGLQKTKLDLLTDYEQKITKPCMVKSRTLMTCREAVFNEALPYKPFFTKEETVIRLHSSDHALDNNDKKEILKRYGLSVDLLSPALLKSTSHMFPLLCKLFSKESIFQALGYKFFLNPVLFIIDELDDMQRHNKLNYATLVLCMLNESSLSKDILKDRKNVQFFNMKIDTLENCELESQTDAFKFVKALSAMEGTYTKQNGVQYTFIHDSIFEICAYHYGKKFPEQMLLYMSSSYIANYVKPHTSESGVKKEKQGASVSIERGEGSDDSHEKEKNDDKSNEREESFDLCIRLREDEFPLLAERLYRDIQNMELYDVFRNPVLKHPRVCQAFIGVLETKSYTELKSLFLSSHGKVDKIVCKQECVKESREGDEQGRQSMLVDERCKRDDEGERLFESTYNVRVFSWVIYYGHNQMTEYMIQQTEQHNETSELFKITGNSPHQSKSGIYTGNEQESESSDLVEQYRLLLLSCFSGDVQTVRVLLPICKKTINGIGQISRGVYWCDHTPLIAACEGGHVAIVKELVKAGGVVNLHNDDGNTPLIAACEKGHVSVMQELMKAGADVNLQDRLRNTPLIASCTGGHVSVVEELLNAGADVNPQDIEGNTPLKIACEGGHMIVVEELVKAGADINHQDDEGNAPLTAAIRKGSLSTVKCLVEYGADWVTQVVDIKVSAVYRALIWNQPDIVKYLVQEQNKIIPDICTGNVHLFNCLVDIKHALVKTDSRDDVMVTDKLVWCMDLQGYLWETIMWGDCNALRHLLCLGLDVNQSIQVHEENIGSFGKPPSTLYTFNDASPLLHTLIDDKWFGVRFTAEKVRIVLEAGADVNVRVRYREYDSVLDREGVSVLEWMRRQLCKYSESEYRMKEDEKEYKEVIREIKKHVRRHSV